MTNPEAPTGPETPLWTLEAWRGLAAWMVVYAHICSFAGWDSPLLRFTYTGVDLFFVISGFVFAPYLLGRQLPLKAFWVRRFFRIYPAYLAALSIYLLLKLGAGQELKYVWQHLLFAHLQSREMAFFYNPVFWSLPSEVEFYLLLPLLAWLAQGKAGRVAGLLVIAWALRLGLGYASNGQTTPENAAFIWMYHLPGMLVEFLLGTAAWLLAQQRISGFLRQLLLALGLMGWFALATVFAQLGDTGMHASPWLRGQISWLAALAFAVMVAATAHAPSGTPEFLKRASTWAGRLSYGIYLLHFAVFQFVETHLGHWNRLLATFCAFGALLVLAWLLYQFWEDPWRRLGRHWAAQLSGTKTKA